MDFARRYWHIIAGVVCVIVLGAVYFNRENEVPLPQSEAGRTVFIDDNLQGQETTLPIPTHPVDIIVHIEGAVARPGVFSLPYGSRVYDVLILAGGATEEADLARINLAAFLQDAQQVIIPTEGEDLPQSVYHPAFTDTGLSNNLVNINTASEAELRTLPGVGEVIAGNIISHREAQGAFSTIDDLMQVPRIGAVTLENLRPLVTVN